MHQEECRQDKIRKHDKDQMQQERLYIIHNKLCLRDRSDNTALFDINQPIAGKTQRL